MPISNILRDQLSMGPLEKYDEIVPHRIYCIMSSNGNNNFKPHQLELPQADELKTSTLPGRCHPSLIIIRTCETTAAEHKHTDSVSRYTGKLQYLARKKAEMLILLDLPTKGLEIKKYLE
ncbi:hypothetical protein SAY87_016830 [Trapa incisa]|uniref:Uncharacterized protein n=1 Tax=Trapa incisa TaxID=236973 RepID=A0AAN7QUR6_9MYRT|nr:hypothetical protein SAY87_016830 [Trapa incisa]